MKKIKLFIALPVIFLALFSLSFISSKNEVPVSSTPTTFSINDNQFLICAMDCGWDQYYEHILDLHFNAWHKYTQPGLSGYPVKGWPGVTNDKYDVPTNQYAGAIQTWITNNRTHGMRSIMNRPKTEYLGTGQCSYYQCESVAQDADYWFYTYNYSPNNLSIFDYTDNSIYGNGIKVKRCVPDPNLTPAENSGYVVKDLKTNHEQANKMWTYYINDDVYPWYVMPKIRIPQNTSDNIPVCTIEVLDWDGKPCKTQTIYSDNFKDNTGNYDGSYFEEYYFNDPYNKSAIEVPVGAICPGPKRKLWDWPGNIHTDFRVKWEGACEMYIDYVRVESEPAHILLKGEKDDDIRSEVDLALYNYNTIGYIPNIFYTEEFEFNRIPCLKYINNIIKQRAAEYNVDLSLMANLNYSLFKVHVPNCWNFEFTNAQMKRFLVDEIGLKTIVNMAYKLEGWEKTDSYDNFYGYKEGNYTENPNISYHPNTLLSTGYSKSTGVLSYDCDPQVYDTWLQNRLENSGYTFDMKMTDEISKSVPNLRLMHLQQSHSYYWEWHKLKEPSNEELDLLVNMAITYGAKGMMYFAYEGFGEYSDSLYCRGLINPGLSPRTQNVYGQNKWSKYTEMNDRLAIWGPYLMSFDNANRHSYIYRDPSDRNLLTQNSYIKEIKTYPNGNSSMCPNFTFDPAYNIPDAINSRYIQVGLFKNPSEIFNKYLMIVNKRCAPGNDACSGTRRIELILGGDNNATYLENFNNWKIINVIDNSLISTFDKRTASTIPLGTYNPGEAKLYKLVPVMQDGGMFVCDESFGGLTVNCQGNVNSNGHSLYINGNTTVEFNADCKLTMENCDVLNISYNTNVYLKGKNGAKWYGIYINNLSEGIDVRNVNFSDIKSGWALNILNCNNAFILNCNFNLEDLNSNENIGAIIVNNSNGPNSSTYIYYNYIYVKNITAAVAIINNAAGGGMGDIEYNTISSSGNGRIGILLTNSVYTDVWNNNISGFNENMHYYCTDVTLRENTLYSEKNRSKGIIGSAWSSLRMEKENEMPSYGGNTISNLGNDCMNLQVDHSTFNSYNGNNNLNVNSGTYSYNLYGSVIVGTNTLNAINCCFNGPNGNAIYHFTDTNGINLVHFTELPHQCNTNPNEDVDYIVSREFNIKDTVYIANDTSNHSFTYPEALYGFFIDNVIKRNYDSIIVQGTALLNNYPDYSYSSTIISKLYMAYAATDSTDTRMQVLKTYYEQLILNNSQNATLVSITNYFIQKCKVALEQYQSALVGFADIILQNPYDQIGVLASWDYAATYLLLDTLPGSGGISNSELSESSYDYELLIDSLRIKKIQKYDTYDKTTFTSSERKELFKKTGNVLIDERNKQIWKFNNLQKETTKGDSKNVINAKKELEELKTINEVAKIKKPKTQTQYIDIINKDINKLVKGSSNDFSKEVVNIPKEYNLSQNYPNPFNPITKINYDLPKDGRVKLVIYDILGREIKSLVNNEFKQAGRYTVEFNGTGFASGVYFYRIQVEEGKSYTSVKKMVLIK